jgi:hypothetical protein
MSNSWNALFIGSCLLPFFLTINAQEAAPAGAVPVSMPGAQTATPDSASANAPSAQTPAPEASPKEAGRYERKSITFVNALWLMDESAHRLPGERVGFILDNIKKGISMSRFDYNPVPETFITDFVSQANAVQIPPVSTAATPGQPGLGLSPFGAAPDPMLDSVTAILERTVVPKILQAVDLNKELRAANLTSEQERNSFMTDKAKTLGITIEDIQKVMNSAYIYIPIIRDYRDELKDSSYSVAFNPGIIWFRISTTGEKARAIPVVRKYSFTQGFGRVGKTYVSSGGLLDYREFAFRSAVKNGVRNIIKATQDIPEFKLSGQVLEKGFMSVSFDLGKHEGVKIDDKYRMMEMVEVENGAVCEKNNGWVLVTSVGDSSGKHGYKSTGRIIAGSPYIGEVVREYPRIPIDIVLKGRMFAFSTDSIITSDLFDSLDLCNAYGFGIDAQYNIGRGMGINQLFFDVGFGMGLGGASGKLNVSTPATLSTCGIMAFEGSLLKKFYFGRFALMLQPLFGFQTVSVRSKKINDSGSDLYFRALNSSLGAAVNAGVEIALGPAVNLGVGAGYQFFAATKEWNIETKTGLNGSWSKVGTYSDEANLKHMGLTVHFYCTWSVPGLPFDPIDMIRASSGI